MATPLFLICNSWLCASRQAIPARHPLGVSATLGYIITSPASRQRIPARPPLGVSATLGYIITSPASRQRIPARPPLGVSATLGYIITSPGSNQYLLACPPLVSATVGYITANSSPTSCSAQTENVQVPVSFQGNDMYLSCNTGSGNSSVVKRRTRDPNV